MRRVHVVALAGLKSEVSPNSRGIYGVEINATIRARTAMVLLNLVARKYKSNGIFSKQFLLHLSKSCPEKSSARIPDFEITHLVREQ